MLIENRTWALFATCLGMGFFSAQPVRADDDGLDKLSEKQLDTALNAELDDVSAGPDDRLPTTEDEMVSAFMVALGDKGDADDKAEQVISLAALEDEAAEAKKSLDDVVRAAVHEALPPPDDEEPPPHEPEPSPPDESEPGQTSTARQTLASVTKAVMSALDAMIRLV